ncbi:hypothetical protein Q5P01_000509 [Channa striata]|uniref:Uncharacterized protein n=1 Tax=Channa striata TaxID=64152 RepID=A0AA88IL30_CHASR|nr:hypothetical protein Q5P01_000509 [Channa striata]
MAGKGGTERNAECCTTPSVSVSTGRTKDIIETIVKERSNDDNVERMKPKRGAGRRTAMESVAEIMGAEMEHRSETEQRGEESRRQNIKYQKDLTVMAEVLGEDRLKTVEVMRAMQEICGGVIAFRETGINKYEDCKSPRVISHLEAYELAAGAKINRKNNSLILGPGADLENADWAFQRAGADIKVLGIYMGANSLTCTRRIWTERIAWYRSRLALWRMRQIGLKGKIIIINALIVPRLTSLTDLCNAVDNFLWKERAHMIAHRTLIGPLKKGGLKLCDLKLKLLSLRTKLMGKFLNHEVEHVWKDYTVCMKTF